MRRLMAVLVLLMVSACAVPTAPRLQLPQPRLAPQAMAAEISLEQRLTLDRTPNGQNVASSSLDTLLEIDATSLRLAAFALGQRVLTLSWDGTELTTARHPLLPAEVDAAYVLRDVQWMYAPLEALRAVLPAGWSLDESSNQRIRTLSHGETVALVIRYETGSRWTGSSKLENKLEGYSLTIESAKQSGG